MKISEKKVEPLRWPTTAAEREKTEAQQRAAETAKAAKAARDEKKS